jgi:hypothetical protein
MMPTMDIETLRGRTAPLDMTAADFRTAGHRLVDQIAGWLDTLASGRVTHDETPADVREALRADRGLPETGVEAQPLLDEAAQLLFDHSLFNGHPRFFGYITSSPAPIGALGDLLASAINQNVGAWRLSPMATEIEAQTVRWIAELIAFPAGCGGLLVSGGNMANFVCFLAARAACGARGRCTSTARRKRTRGFRRRPTCSGWEPMRFDGFPSTPGSGWTWLPSSSRSSPIATMAACRSWSSAPPDRSAPASSIRCRRSPPSAAATISGFTSTAPTARSPRECRERRRVCAR